MIGQKIRKIDVFKKVPTDLTEGSNIGGCVSILTTLVILFFITTEILIFNNPPLTSSLTTRELGVSRKQMKITIDIEFPRYPCELISLDIQDEMFSHHPNIASVKKYRLDKDGKRLDRSDFELLREPDPFVQMQKSREALQNNYGCRVAGEFTVKEAPGNFHISSHAYQANYVRLMMEGLLQTMDVSHKIHRLQFGDIDAKKFLKLDPQAELMRLNRFQMLYDQSLTEHSFLSHYHLSIVPTIYKGSLTDTQTYQYTYNHNSWPTEEMPSVYFNYQIEGIAVEVAPKNSGIMYFFLNLTFIIGGIYALGNFFYELLEKIFGGKVGYELIE